MNSGLDFVINSDGIIHVAFWSGFGAVVLTLLLILYISLLRLISQRNERRKRAFMSMWRELLNEDTLTHLDAAQLPAVANRDLVFFLSYWNQLQNSMRGEARERLYYLARTIGMDSAVRRMLHKGNSTEKLLAIVGLGFFGKKTDLPALKQVLVSDHPLESLYAASAMLHIKPETLGEVLPIIVLRSDFSNAAIANILKEADPESVSLIFSRLLGNVSNAEARQHIRQRDAVRLILLSTIAAPSVVDPLLRDIMDQTEDEEILAACLKVMRDPLDLPKIREFISHPNWRIRVHAVTALGALGEEKDLLTLIKLLSDPQWWVRYRASQAISALPFVTTRHLHGLKKLLADRFAIDMLNHIISERSA